MGVGEERREVTGERGRAGAPIVVKASGLCAGKGVMVCQTMEEALEAVDDMMVKKVFADSGNEVVVEEFLTGEEASFFGPSPPPSLPRFRPLSSTPLTFHPFVSSPPSPPSTNFHSSCLVSSSLALFPPPPFLLSL